MVMWYPQNAEELRAMINTFVNQKIKKSAFPLTQNIHGLVVPHAGYVYSGGVAGKGFGLLKSNKQKKGSPSHLRQKAVVIGPSHYARFYGVRVMEDIKTPLGSVEIIKNDFDKLHAEEHSVKNQIPFLQFLGINKVLPLVIGEIDKSEAEEIAKILIEKYKDCLFVFSTDLSHFLVYNEAVEQDKKTIGIIENLDFSKFSELDVCGSFCLLIMMHLCKLKGWKPRLVEYKNSGDVVGDKSSVVGYASMVF